MSRKARIETILTQELIPSFIQVVNESGNHHVPKDSETHFKVILVSTVFNDKPRLARHKLVNQLLFQEFEQGLHALSMHLYTEEEWEKGAKSVMSSPNCKDGYEF